MYNEVMTTTEATILMINRLSEKEQLSVQRFIKQIFASRKNKSYDLKPISKKEFLKTIDNSEKDIKNGRVYTWEQVREEVRSEYGL